MQAFTLEDYRIQRQYREQRRKQYLSQFELIRSQLSGTQPVSAPPLPSPQSPPAVPKAVQLQAPQAQGNSSDEAEQNRRLKQKLAELQQEERQKLQKFKAQVMNAKQLYMNQIKEIQEIGTVQKTQTAAKLKKLEEQTKAASEKNREIAEFNGKIEQDCDKSGEIMEKYAQEIEDEYSQKLGEFDKIYNSSNDKINSLETEQSDNEFVEATLQNPELVNSIRENANRADEEIDKMIEDYSELLRGKQEILEQLSENNVMKEEEIAKMAALEDKIKHIFEKLGQEKQIYLEENQKMSAELLEVKDLLTRAMAG